ncbi:MAG: preprotein translocase subunit SecG [Desulfobacterales bacterium]|nr:preprotein translocase subunit SecG [Desulfobacterales bacterium]
MQTLLIIVHILACIGLILIVLLQTGKGADMGAAFGGGGSQTLFGSTGAATFLSKVTTIAAVVFMLTSLSLAYVSGNSSKGSIVLDSAPAAQEQTVPAEVPAPAEQPAE